MCTPTMGNRLPHIHWCVLFSFRLRFIRASPILTALRAPDFRLSRVPNEDVEWVKDMLKDSRLKHFVPRHRQVRLGALRNPVRSGYI
jgi:hypothetical protein